MSVSLALHFFLWSYYNYQPFFLDSAFVGWSALNSITNQLPFNCDETRLQLLQAALKIP